MKAVGCACAAQIHGMLGFLQDENPAIRITAAEQLGDARPQHLGATLQSLSQTIRFDARSDVRRACLLSIVKASDGGLHLERAAWVYAGLAIAATLLATGALEQRLRKL